MTDKPITEMELNDLKALAYDQIRLLERCQQNLQVLNAEIAKLEQQDQESD